MAGEIALDSYAPLVEEAVAAFRADFRYSEAVAKTAGVLLARRELMNLKRAA